MMTNTKHAHHQEILSILQNLNSKYLEQEGILFAGGTRITLEGSFAGEGEILR